MNHNSYAVKEHLKTNLVCKLEQDELSWIYSDKCLIRKIKLQYKLEWMQKLEITEFDDIIIIIIILSKKWCFNKNTSSPTLQESTQISCA